ncbi:MMPL family transporter [Actinokineospora iranica]|uniref:Putative drug exporter of the RND superfamily n=1 Tax=Actinokineospora iranica TaxID=1271860 RepID=A0A1G6WLV9_9PSEU|nr:MMPL family transporter [Actinokineospora iranica]SDD66774.1 putative drug exporter of the RND superfamily [Actinokineospora iranica]
MRPLALFCYRHAWWIIAVWLVLLAGVTVTSRASGIDYRDVLALPAADSTQAQDLLRQTAGGVSGAQERVVFAADKPVSDAGVRARIEPMLADIARLPHVTAVVSPYTPEGQAQISPQGRIAFATVTYGVAADDVDLAQARALVDTARSAEGAGLRVAVDGAVAARTIPPPNLNDAGFGLLAAAIVLLVTFGSLFSMLVPILTAVVSVATAAGVVGLLTHTMDVPAVSQEIVALLGLGVGVDYALFVVTRYRQGLVAGEPPEAALGHAAVTSGRSVLFAGVTVCVSLLGMFTVGIDFLDGIAISASVAVLMTMVAALTLLPALLRLFGIRMLSRRLRTDLARRHLKTEPEGKMWAALARGVTRRPLWSTLAALLVIGVLSLPVLSLRLGVPDAGLHPPESTSRQAYDLLADGFGPGFTGPLVVVGRVDTDGQRQAVLTARRQLAELDEVALVPPPLLSPTRDGRTIAALLVYPKTAPQDPATDRLVDRVRGEVVPAAVRGTGATLHVGGSTAVQSDFARAITDRLPLFLGTVVAISFVLLVIVFRSLLIPLTAALMNLLAAAAMFGVLTAVFQWGWFASATGLDGTGPIEPYIPVFLFAGLFGLSMDYEVFLVGRIQEEWHKRRDTIEATVHGLASTGRTITAAALIMGLVFVSFVPAGDRVVKESGLGLTIAVLLDAVVIRVALVPAIMALFGRANWWLPGFLDRLLPRLDIEGPRPGGFDWFSPSLTPAAPRPATRPAPLPPAVPGGARHTRGRPGRADRSRARERDAARRGRP